MVNEIKIYNQSDKWKMNSIDWSKIGKGALIAFGGLGLTFLTETLTRIDFGEWNAVVIPLTAVLINFGWKLLKNKESV